MEPQAKSPDNTVAIRIAKDVAEQVKILANAERRSVANMLTVLAQEAIAQRTQN